LLFRQAAWHATLLHPFLHVVDLKRALNFGEAQPLALFVSLVFLLSLVSRRLEKSVATAPIVFTVAGMLISSVLQGILRAGFCANVALHIAEVGLVMLLFTDASRTDLNVLRSIRNPADGCWW
jgi:hypothetical protein